MRSFNLRRLRGFTLVELMIVVAIIGVLAALAIYGVSRYLRNAKTAEARSGVGAMAKGNISYFNAEQGVTTVLPAGSTAGTSNKICSSATPVPATIAAVQGKKYQSADTDWGADKATPGKGFSCLKFSMDQPQYFMYTYVAAGVGSGTDTFTATANGDLNGDGNTSAFTYMGAVQSQKVKMAPAILETAPEELVGSKRGSPPPGVMHRAGLTERNMALLRSRPRGFTLVELMIVVAIIGVLAALAIYGVSRYLRNAKTAEARAMIGAMAKGNISYYNAEQWTTTTVLPAGSTAGAANVVCASTTVTVPASITAVQGVKYQSADTDWSVDSAAKGVGFACLKFAIGQPQAFMYDYKAAQAQSANATFQALAYGDLNGDGNTSRFEYNGAIQSAKVTLAPAILEQASDE